MNKYWWIIRTDINYGLPFDTFVKWYNIPKLIYWLAKYISKQADYSLTFTWVDMDSNIGEESLFVFRERNKCIDCVENERLYGSDTDEYMVGEYANNKNGLCDLHNEIHIDIAHYNESYCDFCEMKVKEEN